MFLHSAYKRYHIFVLLWLTSLSMTISSSIHVAANDIISLFLWLSNIPLWIYLETYTVALILRADWAWVR